MSYPTFSWSAHDVNRIELIWQELTWEIGQIWRHSINIFNIFNSYIQIDIHLIFNHLMFRCFSGLQMQRAANDVDPAVLPNRPKPTGKDAAFWGATSLEIGVVGVHRSSTWICEKLDWETPLIIMLRILFDDIVFLVAERHSSSPALRWAVSDSHWLPNWRHRKLSRVSEDK